MLFDINLIRKYCSEIYFWSLVVLAASLPFSPFLISLSQIVLLANWLIDKDLYARIKRIYKRKSVLAFLSIYAVHLVWLAGTQDFDFAPQDLKIKLPLLILPIIIGTSEPLEVDRVKLLLKIFIVSVVAATLLSALLILDLAPYEITDVRESSMFISHIRFSLMIVTAILIMMHWIKHTSSFFKGENMLFIISLIWLIFFLILLKSLTGIVVLIVAVFVLILVFVNRIENQFLKVGLIMLMYAIPFFTCIGLISAYNSFYKVDQINLQALPKYTQNGNLYAHQRWVKNIENGHYVWLYVCEKELRREWNKRSTLKYDSADLKTQPVRTTLIRYLTSKGLTKDSLGIARLKEADVSNIQKGLTNYIFEEKWLLTPRIYEVIWEIDNYKNGGNVNRHSVTQRFVYMGIALDLIKKHFFFGIGSGDLPMAYANYYKTHDTGLSQDRQKHTHNQFLRFFTVFGLIGFAVVMAGFIWPAFLERRWKSYYFLMIFIIMILSFVNEDTLETQAGVTFITFFYALFLWGAHRRFA